MSELYLTKSQDEAVQVAKVLTANDVQLPVFVARELLLIITNQGESNAMLVKKCRELREQLEPKP